ncbi:MAG: PAS domain-containing protein, partial [Gemmataceae bacterium]
MMTPARLLVYGRNAPDVVAHLGAAPDVVRAETPAAALDQLRQNSFTAVLAEPEALAELLDACRRGDTVLTNTDRGIATLDPQGRVTWGNPTFRRWCPRDPLGLPLLDAFDADPSDSTSPTILATDDANPLRTAASGTPAQFRIHRPHPADPPYLDIQVRPVLGAQGAVSQLVVMMQNVTAEVEQQKRLDALHQAGRDMATLEPDQLAEMNLPTRIELLKQNLRHYIHDLLHYDTIEVRLLDRRTGELKPLLEDGMTAEAAARVLYARPHENGVTGFVAFTGKSYLCADTTADPH